MFGKITLNRQTCVSGEHFMVGEYSIPKDISLEDAKTLVKMKKAEWVKVVKPPRVKPGQDEGSDRELSEEYKRLCDALEKMEKKEFKEYIDNHAEEINEAENVPPEVIETIQRVWASFWKSDCPVISEN
jgi:hypothetical protein